MESATVARVGPSPVLVGCWFGLAAGLTEVGLRGAQLAVGQRIHLSQQFVWMAPVADVLLYGLAGLAIGAAARRWPQRANATTMVFVGTLLFVAAPLYAFQRLNGWALGILALGVAFQAAKWTAARPQLVRRIVLRTIEPMLAAVLLLGAAVNAWLDVRESREVAGLPAARSGAPNVLLIILDTVRAASLGLYGHDRDTSPQLRRFATDAFVFDRAIAPSPWTLPSHASMFTGVDADRLEANWRSPLSEATPTLAEVLAYHGYRTAGFSANLGYVTYETGLERGFQHFEDYPISPTMVLTSSFATRFLAHRMRNLVGSHAPLVRRSAASVNAHFLDWLEAESDEGRPFFAFLNYFDAHDPYLPPEPFDTLFGGIEPMAPLSLMEPEWTAEEVEASRDAYEAAIAYEDHELGRLIGELRRRGVLDRTIVIVTSDHGEHFGDHGLLYHANSLYMAALHVPLVIRPPGGVEGERIARPVSLTELPGTILRLADLPTGPIPGTPLLGPQGAELATGHGPVRASVRKTINMAAWLPASKGDMVSSISNGLHYIRNGDGSEELYRYGTDPEEQRNLAHQPELRGSLESMRRIAAGRPPRTAARLERKQP